MARLSALVPLIILLIIVAVAGYIGYQLYLWSNELTDRGRKKMEEKHIAFSKDGGLKVGVPTISDEEYAAAQQNYLVKAWNASSFPAYRSKLWNREETLRQQKLAEDAKKAHMRSATATGSAEGAATGSSTRSWSKTS